MTLIDFYYCGHICIVESGTLFRFVYSMHFLFVYQNCSKYYYLQMVWFEWCEST